MCHFFHAIHESEFITISLNTWLIIQILWIQNEISALSASKQWPFCFHFLKWKFLVTANISSYVLLIIYDRNTLKENIQSSKFVQTRHSLSFTYSSYYFCCLDGKNIFPLFFNTLTWDTNKKTFYTIDVKRDERKSVRRVERKIMYNEWEQIWNEIFNKQDKTMN